MAQGVIHTASTVTVTGGGDSDVEPFVTEDFSTYGDTADFLTDPRGIYKASEYITPESMVIDTSDGYGTSTQCLRYDFPDRTSDLTDRCHDYTISCSLAFPNDGDIQEVWVELAAKTDVGFLTQAPDAWSCGGVSDQGLKLIDGNVYPGDRFSVGLRTGLTPPSTGQLWFGYPNNVTDPEGKVDFADSANASDGQWHVYRCYWRISTGFPSAPNADGQITCWVDGVKVVDEDGIQTGSTATGKPPEQFTFLSLGRNLNQGPAHAQSLYWGLVKIYDTDPGWT